MTTRSRSWGRTQVALVAVAITGAAGCGRQPVVAGGQRAVESLIAKDPRFFAYAHAYPPIGEAGAKLATSSTCREASRPTTTRNVWRCRLSIALEGRRSVLVLFGPRVATYVVRVDGRGRWTASGSTLGSRTIRGCCL